MSENTADPTRSASENTIGGRVRRYAQVSTAIANQAARYAGQRVTGRTVDRKLHAEELKAALGGLKGPLMKVVQILSTIPDALPPEYAAEFSQLQNQAPPMGRPFVRRRMAAELGADWQSQFEEFPLDAAAAASLGQVHKAKTRDGRAVACKLQYSGIESAVEADLKQLRFVISLYRRYDQTIDPSLIYEEIAERLREELDYRREAKHIALYGDFLEAEPNVHVPEVIGELSTKRLLTMSWLDGTPLVSFKDADVEARNQIALNMFRAWYAPFYRYGVIHGDPHLGNYTVREDRSINLLDYGCVRIFPPRFVKGVIDLYWALMRDDKDLAVSAYEAWGFRDLSLETIEILNQWAEFVYAPLMEDAPRTVQSTNSGARGRQVVGSVHEKLRAIGGVQPPREFVFMDRAAIGLGSVFMHLDAEINWYRLFMDLVSDFDAEKLEQEQRAMLDRHGLEHPS